MRKERLLIFGKYPRAGEVKTRLVPPLTFDEAAALYRAFLLDAVDAYVRLVPAVEPLLYIADPADREAAESLLNGVIEVRGQYGDSLAARLEHAFASAFDEGCDAVCAIGTDHPTLPVEYVHRAFEALRDHDLAVGPAEDGGYYLLGLRAMRRAIFDGLPFSTSRLMEETMRVAEGEGMRCTLLPGWYDVDGAGSLERLKRECGMLPEASRTRAEIERMFGTNPW